MSAADQLTLLTKVVSIPVFCFPNQFLNGCKKLSKLKLQLFVPCKGLIHIHLGRETKPILDMEKKYVAMRTFHIKKSKSHFVISVWSIYCN